MTERRQLLQEIEAFLVTYDMRASYFGRDAVNDTALVSRLRGAGDVRLTTAERVRKFMRDYAATHEPVVRPDGEPDPTRRKPAAKPPAKPTTKSTKKNAAASA